MPVTRDCSACGGDVTRSPSRMPEGRVFCSKECMGLAYEDKVETACSECGENIEVTPAKYESYENNFCNNKCMYAFQKGENAPNWRGGSDKFTATPEGREWREQVFEEADYTCEDCGRTNCRLNAHHIEGRSESPEKKADPDNGSCLCLPCHARVHFEQGDMGAYRLIKGNINRLDNV